MKRLWLFRSDIKHLEYYHKYTTLEEFEKKCHDFYLLMCLWGLKNNYLGEVIIWRLSNNPPAPITFDIHGKKFHQFWVRNLSQTKKYPSPDISFWRGGFMIYDVVTQKWPNHYGKKIYLGAGKRRTPQWGGKYDLFLMEDERDYIKGLNCAPFYKTASPEVFKPIMMKPKYDVCWPCNFKQISQKGQEYFIKTIGSDKRLKSLKIVHCGNMPRVGKNLCKKYGVSNIKFMGPLDRPDLNKVLNLSKSGIVLSNRKDGCPRVLTEIVMSGTPLLVRNTTHFLSEYKEPGLGVITFDPTNIGDKILEATKNWVKYKAEVLRARRGIFSYDETCKRNIEIWQKN